MRVLLTGASGFLGRHVQVVLRSQGVEVVALGRSPPLEADEWLEADLLHARDLGSIVQRARASHLLHLAWYTEHGAYWNSPVNVQWVDASVRLLQAFMAQGGRHVVMAGSCAEYDWSHGYLREDSTPLQPASLYGAAKDATRRLTQALCAEEGISMAWAHVFYPFGAGEDQHRVLPSLIRVFRGLSPAFGVNALAYRGLLPVRDAAAALVHLLSLGHSGRYNICSGQPVAMHEVVRTLAQICEADSEQVLRLASARPGDPHLLVGDNQRLLATGWRPTCTLRQGLEQQVAAFAAP